LADQSTMFPAYVDPQFGTGASRWAYANSDNHNNNDGYAWVGLDPYNNDLVRSYFDFPVGRLAGTHVLSATFATKLRHSWSCTSTPAYLYRTGGFSGTPRVAWGSVGLQQYLDAQSAHGNKDDGCADNPQPDVMMYYGNNLRSDVQLAADQGWGNYSVALSAAG